MKINDYKVEVNEEGKHQLFAIRNTEKIYVGDVVGDNAEQIESNALQLLDSNNMQIVDISETILEKEDLTDRKADLTYVRNKMRSVLKDLSDPNKTLQEKKDGIDVYEVMCKAADVITKACIVELTYDRFSKGL